MNFDLSIDYLGASDEVVVWLYCPLEGNGCDWRKKVAEGRRYHDIDSLNMQSFLQEHVSKDH